MHYQHIGAQEVFEGPDKSISIYKYFHNFCSYVYLSPRRLAMNI